MCEVSPVIKREHEAHSPIPKAAFVIVVVVFPFMILALMSHVPVRPDGHIHLAQQHLQQTGSDSMDGGGAAMSPVSHEPDIVCPELNITIGYNVMIWPSQNWRLVVGGQLQDLEDSDLHVCAELVIVLSIPQEFPGYTYLGLMQLMQQATNFVREQVAGENATILHEYGNSHEFPAMYNIWKIAHDDTDTTVAHKHLFMYIHTKGMVNHGFLEERFEGERRALNATIIPWRAIVQQFLVHDDIRAVARVPSTWGFAWGNFWWSRGDWIKTLHEPRRDVSSRYWFEFWLGGTVQEKFIGDHVATTVEYVDNSTKVLSMCTCGFDRIGLEGIKAFDQTCVEVTPWTCMP